MAKHKSATEVTVVTEEKSLLQQWVDKHWIKMAALGVVLAGVVLFKQFQTQSATKAMGDRWNGLLAAEGDLEKVQGVTAGLEDSTLKGWGMALTAQEAMVADKPVIAAEALTELTADAGHILNSKTFGFETKEGRVSPAAFAQHGLAAQFEWETAHPDAFNNPAPAADSPKVVIHTSEGDIEVTLYQAKAPKHVENFLKLVDEGFYNDTLFHRVVNNANMAIVQGGDPNSKEEDVTQWGQGGPGYSLDGEKNGLIHDIGYMSAALPPSSQQSSGSQFFFTLARAHYLDDRHTIFGKITGGMDVATKINEAPIRDADPDSSTRDIPVNPVSITSIDKL
ncbi:MAG: cyclophilin family peptidyl-prolyl cis-trans isomerase [Planctomycetota bacterium]|jgi:cyclophilin family peptidyl-prolyl cis-trans isomerase